MILTALALVAVSILGAIFAAVPEVRAREALAWALVVGGVVLYMGLVR